MDDNRTSRWGWRAIEAAALAAVLFSLHQTRQQVEAVEERVQILDAHLAESGARHRQIASPAALQPGSGASFEDQEALARRIVALLRANGSPGAAAAQRAPAPEPEAAPLANAEAENRVRQAQRVVGDALARGKLERQAITRLRELQSQSGNDPRFAAMRDEIIAAINQQKLIPEDVAFIAF